MNVDFRKIVARDASIGAGNFFDRFATAWPAREAIILQSEERFVVGANDFGTTLTVGLLRDIVLRLASWLAGSGIQPGARVAVYLCDSAAYYLYYLALTYVGAIPVLLNSNMPEEVAGQYFIKVGCVAILIDQARAQRLMRGTNAPLQGTRVLVTQAIALPSTIGSCQPFSHQDGDTVLIAHTSGTTGAPKPVQFTHRGYFYGVRQQMYHFLGRRVLSALPHSHGAAITLFMSTVVRGVPLFAQTGKEASQLLDAIERQKPNLVMAFPKPLVSLCRAPLEERNLESVSCWMSTGDASHERHIRTLMAVGHRTEGGRVRAGSWYIDNLGSSEVAFGMLRNVHSPDTNRYDRCIGSPFEWVQVNVFGEDGRAVGTNQVGRLGVKSPSVTSGYLHDSAATSANLLDGFWLTGDLVYRGEDGLYYHVDRTTDRELIAGRPLYSCQLEELLMKRIAGIFDCTVVGIGSGSGKRVVVAVEPTDESCDPGALQEQISEVITGIGVEALVDVTFVEPAWNDGLTGKKLKRLARVEFGARGANRCSSTELR